MKTAFLKRVSTLALVAAAAGTIAFSAPQKAVADDARISDAERAKIEQVVKDLLQREPEVILDALDNYQAKKAAQQAEMAKTAIEKNKELFKSGDLPSIGNKDGDITMVEFFDYHCGYCKRALPDVVTLHKNDPKLHIVFLDFPILSPESETAAKAALAAHKQGKYWEFHQKLMAVRGKMDEAVLEKTAEDVGMDVDAMKEFMASDEASNEIQRNKDLARSIGISGTPAFIINDKFLPGAVGLAEMTRIIKQVRKQDQGGE